MPAVPPQIWVTCPPQTARGCNLSRGSCQELGGRELGPPFHELLLYESGSEGGRPRGGLSPPPSHCPPSGGKALRHPRSVRYSPRRRATVPRRHRPLGAPRLRGAWVPPGGGVRTRGEGASGGRRGVGGTAGGARQGFLPRHRARNELHLAVQARQKGQRSCRAPLFQHCCLQIPARTPAYLAHIRELGAGQMGAPALEHGGCCWMLFHGFCPHVFLPNIGVAAFIAYPGRLQPWGK